MIANILRWSIRAALVVPLLVVAAMVTFWVAASIRETALRDELAPPTGRLVPTRSGLVFVQEKGPANGVPVVLFHGTAAWSELWRRTIDALAGAGFRVIALDLPPFGFSDRPGSYTRRDQAARQGCARSTQGCPGHHRRSFIRRRSSDRTRDAIS